MALETPPLQKLFENVFFFFVYKFCLFYLAAIAPIYRFYDMLHNVPTLHISLS